MKTCCYSLPLIVGLATASKLHFRDDDAGTCTVTFEGGKLLAPCAFETETTASIWDAIHDLQRDRARSQGPLRRPVVCLRRGLHVRARR